MQKTDKKPILFWALVIGIFCIVFLFWLPSFIASVRTLIDSIGSKSNESAQDFEKNVTPQIDELKRTFDTLVKSLPAEEKKFQQQEEPAPSLEKTPTSAVTQTESGANPRQYCEKTGGIHQSRPGCTFCSGKTPVQPYDVCIFLDGSECEQKMFQKGECKKGQTQTAEDLIKIGVVPY